MTVEAVLSLTIEEGARNWAGKEDGSYEGDRTLIACLPSSAAPLSHFSISLHAIIVALFLLFPGILRVSHKRCYDALLDSAPQVVLTSFGHVRPSELRQATIASAHRSPTAQTALVPRPD